MGKLAAVTVILGALHLTEGQPCTPGTYMDEVTGRCDPCSDICQFKEIMGTVAECLTRCPDYITTEPTTFSNQFSTGYNAVVLYDSLPWRSPIHIYKPLLTLLNCAEAPDCLDLKITLKKGALWLLFQAEFDYEKTTVTDWTSSVPTSTPLIPRCNGGQVYLRSTSRCESCSYVCAGYREGRTSMECQIQCPREYRDKKHTLSMSKDQVVATSVVVLCVTIIIVAAAGLLTLYCRKRRRPRDPPPQEAPVTPLHLPHPTVTYVPVPIHVQCEDSMSQEPEEDGPSPTQEQQKFPSAFPDLPSCARPVHGVNGDCRGLC